MSTSQALAVAFGLAFAVHAFLYLVWRSGGNDRTGSILTAVFTGLSVSLHAGAGSFLLLMRWPNTLIGVGFGILLYTWALKRGFLGWYRIRRIATPLPRVGKMLRIYFLGNVLGGCLCLVGCVMYGGPLGWLGFFVAFYWTVTFAWALRRIVAEQAVEQTMAS